MPGRLRTQLFRSLDSSKEMEGKARLQYPWKFDEECLFSTCRRFSSVDDHSVGSSSRIYLRVGKVTNTALVEKGKSC